MTGSVLALTVEGLIVVIFGGVILLVMLFLYAIRGHGEPTAGGSAGIVKISAPASIVGMLVGAVLILIGSGFLSLGPDFGDNDDGDPDVAAAPEPPPTTTTAVMRPLPPSTEVLGAVAEPRGELAATGSGMLTLTGSGLLLMATGKLLTPRRG